MFERRRVAIDEPKHRASLPEMALHDFRHVLRLDAGVPDAFRVDHQVRPPFAEPERPAGGQLDVVDEAARGKFPAQSVNRLCRTAGGAPRHAVRLLLVAHEHVVLEQLHDEAPTVPSDTCRPARRAPGYALSWPPRVAPSSGHEGPATPHPARTTCGRSRCRPMGGQGPPYPGRLKSFFPSRAPAGSLRAAPVANARVPAGML